MRIKTRLSLFLLAGAAYSLLVSCTPPKEIGSFSPAIAYDTINERYLVVSVKVKSEETDRSRIDGMFIDIAGSPVGSEFTISEDGGEYYCPSVVYDDAQDRFLVVWNGASSVFGQFVNSDGTLNGPRITLTETANSPCGRCSSVAYNSVQGTFLAAWGEKNPSQHDNIYAQLIAADGSLDGPKLALSADGAYPAFPSAAYDSINQRFFTVWDSADHHGIKGRMINPDGTFVAKDFFLYSDTGVQYWPTVSYDSVNTRFLVSWEHSDTNTFALLGQLVNADGTLYQPFFTISQAGLDVSYHASVYDGADKKYFLLFGDFANNERVYGQAVTADGALDTTVSPGNIQLSYADYPGDRRPAVALDSINHRFFGAWNYDGEQAFCDIHGRLIHGDGTPAGPIGIISNGGVW